MRTRGAAWLWAAVFAVAVWAAPAGAEFVAESLDNDFRGEIEAAAQDGKNLVIMFHQIGCPYCDKMRARVLPSKKVMEFYDGKFVLIESNIRGDLEVVTPKGEQTVEKKFARAMRVRATPVFVFFDKDGNDVLRLVGFIDVDGFVKAGRYVRDGVYKTDKSFIRYLADGG
ncbi:MAG: thioredoxin fold domain-containing protein [Hyphomicrobiales bacterium]|nr:thioredoxin fold domain-containing protein [Hyphomicrobiales bacterium]